MPSDPSRAKRDGLCRACSGINIEQIAEPEGYAHHRSISDWISSSTSCRLCHIMLEQAKSITGLPGYILDGTHFRVQKALEEEDFQNDYGLRLTWIRGSNICSLVAYKNIQPSLSTGQSEDDFRITRLEFYANNDDPAADFGAPLRRSLPQNTSDDASIDVVRLWLEQCQKSHHSTRRKVLKWDNSFFEDDCAACPRNDTTEVYAAARLLEISSSHVRVVSSSGISQPYTTLSYSWGDGPKWPWGPYRIERHALHDMVKSALSRDALPKTIRDAVYVTERLGLHYIWVDVLCIEQDDSDILKESIKMATIYSQALVNIAASNSSNSQTGLFNTRSRSQHHGFAAHIPVETNLYGRLSSLFFYQRSHRCQIDVPGFPASIEMGDDAYDQEVNQGRLAKRGWVLQERICSPRIIHFGTTQVFWQCNRTTKTEDNLGTDMSMSIGNHMDVMDTWKWIFFPVGLRAYVNTESLTAEDLERWQYTLAESWFTSIIPLYYSGKQLTYWDDKLLAIAGLAKRIWEQQPSMRYIAGHWRESLPASLLWYVSPPGRRITPYVAPSWSWASMQGAICHDDDTVIGDDSTLRCDLLDCWIETSNGDQFGRVLSAGLVLEVAGYKATVRRDDEQTQPCWARPRSVLEFDDIHPDESHAEMDEDCDEPLRVYALLVKQLYIRQDEAMTRKDWRWVLLLVTPKDENEREFTRVGFGRMGIAKAAFPSHENLTRSDWILV